MRQRVLPAVAAIETLKAPGADLEATGNPTGLAIVVT